jgi:IclR family acetate operon transcriptional repressor
VVHYYHHWFVHYAYNHPSRSSDAVQTVDKAVELLGYFSERQPEYGLSDLARTAGFDKASTRRLLLALIKHDYIEQNHNNKAYRLGPGVLRLARVRETSLPLASLTTPLLEELVQVTGESAHFSLLAGGRISSIGVVETTRSNRINFVLGEEGPLHATASGIVCLAYSGDNFVANALKDDLPAYTQHTVTDKAEFLAMLRTVRESGYYINREQYELDVCSIAAPVFDNTSQPIGALAVASPSSRFSREIQKHIRVAVSSAAARASQALGCEQSGSEA